MRRTEAPCLSSGQRVRETHDRAGPRQLLLRDSTLVPLRSRCLSLRLASAHAYLPHNCPGHPTSPPVCRSGPLANQQWPLNLPVPDAQERLKSAESSSIFSPNRGSPGSLRKAFLKLDAHPMSSSQRGHMAQMALLTQGGQKIPCEGSGQAWPLDTPGARLGCS